MPNDSNNPNAILIHYSEIGLKGQNRPYFQRVLASHIKKVIPPSASITLSHQRYIVRGFKNRHISQIISALQNIFGIAWAAPAWEHAPSLENVREFLRTQGGMILGDARTFRIRARRADKTFPQTSKEIENALGQEIVDTWGRRVDLSHPQREIFIEILPRSIFIYTDISEGLRGLPVGTSGKVLSLFSGGIDSPVSSWLMMRRGALPLYLHVHSFRSANELAGSKLETLFRVLARHTPSLKAYFVPFFHFQTSVLTVPQGYELLLFRRFLVKLSEKLARQTGAQALVMGDNLGQVASQTLPYLALTDYDITLPILRPLIGHTKEEIIDLAKKIGTYELSIEEYKDCCSIVAAHPTLRPKAEILKKLETEIGLDDVVEKSLREVEKKEYA